MGREEWEGKDLGRILGGRIQQLVEESNLGLKQFPHYCSQVWTYIFNKRAYNCIFRYHDSFSYLRRVRSWKQKHMLLHWECNEAILNTGRGVILYLRQYYHNL